MKASKLVLAVIMTGLAFNGAIASSKKTGKEKPPAQQAAAQTPAAPDNYEQKIAEMQQSIDKLRADIQNIQNSRNELQTKLEQSDKDVADKMNKIEEIKNKIAEKQKAAGALATEKKQ